MNPEGWNAMHARASPSSHIVLAQEIRFTSNSLHLRVNTDFTCTLLLSLFWLLKTAIAFQTGAFRIMKQEF